MKNEWNEREARKCKGDLLKLRVYTSRLLGRNRDLVMHGGGNTSVKVRKNNLFGEKEDILYVKGSGWDLATIKPEGFAPVRIRPLIQMAGLKDLKDVDMVKNQRAAMTDPSAPTPSVEAILHAIIPYTFVDHTHADAVVTITNTPGGRKKIQDIYGPRILIIPYVMPGFILARKIYEMTRHTDWEQMDGMILLNHGVFTFHDDPGVSYENMTRIVTKAERYLKDHTSPSLKGKPGKVDPLQVAKIRKKASLMMDKPILAQLDQTPDSVGYGNLPNIKKVSNRGPITPDHIIRTKRAPIVIGDGVEKEMDAYAQAYQTYFDKHENGDQVMLDPAPRWAILPGTGSVYMGATPKALQIIRDIAHHTQRAIQQAEQLGGWKPLGRSELFEMEYWSLEQAKLKKAGSSKLLEGKIALVTGAASGIGKACTEELATSGAVVAALDIDPKIEKLFSIPEILSLTCDVTKPRQIINAIENCVKQFGGLDMVVSNAGIFPKSASIEDMNEKTWRKSLEINVTAHQQLLQATIPYLKLGIDPAITIIGSKNVPAPGPGASAYSVAKAGLAQLGRVAALELGEYGIRVNTLHPNAVFDTAIWTEEVLKNRAHHYGVSVDEYKTNNLLKVEVTSRNVAIMAVATLGPTFSKTTGAQIPVDGGNERII